jgi:hypothetical protein
MGVTLLIVLVILPLFYTGLSRILYPGQVTFASDPEFEASLRPETKAKGALTGFRGGSQPQPELPSKNEVWCLIPPLASVFPGPVLVTVLARAVRSSHSENEAFSVFEMTY